MFALDSPIRALLREGAVLPACPLALNARRRMDERRQRALCRYYLAAGAGGLAAGVHTSQFQIRDPKVGLFAPLLQLVSEEMDRANVRHRPLIKIGGICGRAPQALKEASLLRELNYHAGLLSLAALARAPDDELLAHCRRVAEVIPLIGFYLQPAVGGRLLSYSFWRGFLEIERVVAIKIAPFNRYQTLDVMRASAESGRDDVALYTGNDDHIVLDLLTPFAFATGGATIERRMTGGLLGQWAVWTSKAVELLDQCHRVVARGKEIPAKLLRLAGQITDANAAIFDAAHGYQGCIAGIHEILRRQGLLAGIWCLDPKETLSRGQAREIDRVCAAYPHLSDDQFVRMHLNQWLQD